MPRRRCCLTSSPRSARSFRPLSRPKVVLANLPSNPLDPMLHDLAKPWTASRAVIDACRPYERRDDFPRVVGVSAALAAEVFDKWGEELGWRTGA